MFDLFNMSQSQQDMFQQQQMGYAQQPQMMQGDMFSQGQMQGNMFQQSQMQGNMFQQPYCQPNMYQQPMSYGYDNQMMGYNMQTPRINKASVMQYIQSYVINLTQVPISKVEKIDETPDILRHACVEVGDVSYLQVNKFPIQELGIYVMFYFCKACGKLYIQKDFM